MLDYANDYTYRPHIWEPQPEPLVPPDATRHAKMGDSFEKESQDGLCAAIVVGAKGVDKAVYDNLEAYEPFGRNYLAILEQIYG